MKTSFLTLLLYAFLGQGIIYSQQNQLQIKSSAVSPIIDGVLDENNGQMHRRFNYKEQQTGQLRLM